jgi:MFS family permease
MVLMLMAFAFVCHFNRIGISVAGEARIMKQYEISDVLMGTIYSSYLVAYTICMMPGGWIVDRFGPRRAMLAMGIGSALFVALTGAIGIVHSIGTTGVALAAFWCVRIALGVVSAPMHPGAARSISQWLPRQQRALGNGLVTAAALLGIASTYFVFGAMIDWLDWPAAFAICGAVTAILACIWAVFASDRVADDEPSHAAISTGKKSAGSKAAREAPATPTRSTDATRVIFALMRNRSLILLTLSYATVGYFQYLMFYWVEHYFKDSVHLSEKASRLNSTIVNLGMAAGMFLGGFLSDWIYRRFGPRTRPLVPVVGMVLGAGFTLFGLFAVQPQWIVFWFTMAMGAFGMAEGPCWVLAIELGGRRGGSSAAIFNTGANLGGLLAPMGTPLISRFFDDWRVGIGFASVLCFLGATLWFWIDPSERVELDTP